MKIRNYEEKDKEFVRFVCLNCDEPFNSSEKSKNFFLSVYCDYYIEHEPDNCFVVADENDVAVGYIISTEDFDKFKVCFLEEYYTRLDENDFLERQSAIESFLPQEEYKNDYPAHFHIDIMPDFQRMGFGSQLIDTLVEHLKQKNIKGLMLTVWNQNEKGCNFYIKYGFTLLEERKNVNVFGLKIN